MCTTTTLPETNQVIRAHLKNGDILTGIVRTVWLAIDTPCVNMWTHGTMIQFFPGLGDSWEPA